MARNDEIVLCYGDVVLHKSDVRLLSPPQWLNDTIIEFYFEYLSKCKYANNQDCLFIGPSVTLCLKASKSMQDLAPFLDPLDSKAKNLIIFALNDHRVYGMSGGTHWSLLVYSRQEKVIFHYDSYRPSNLRQAAQVAQKLLRYLIPEGNGNFIDDEECLEQKNGYDCGVHVICQAEHVTDHFLANRTIKSCPKLEISQVETKRKNLHELINELKN